MRPTVFICLAGLLLLAGCARTSVESRKQERSAAYTALDPAAQQLVNEGRIAVGMSMDAVYIAWGKPSQILESEDAGRHVTTWLYHGTHFEEYRYWSYRAMRFGPRHYTEPYLRVDYLPRDYVKAEVQFEQGRVFGWRTLPVPQ